MNEEVEVNEIMLKQFTVKLFLIYITQWCIFKYLNLFSEFFIQMSDTVFYFLANTSTTGLKSNDALKPSAEMFITQSHCINGANREHECIN